VVKPAGAPAKATARTPAKKAPAAAPVAKPVRKSTVTCPLSGFEVKPDKANLSPRTVERLRTLLVDERERHLHQADELAAEAEALAVEREGGDTQFDEESGEGDTVNVERERDLLLSASARQIVEEIDRALERMDRGTYGLCVPAGRRISIERLEALPYADTCVDCKARAERRR
jgi:RNA polymerase-binding transcription factor DksA